MASLHVNELVNFVRKEIPKNVVDCLKDFETKFPDEVINYTTGWAVPSLDRLYVNAANVWEELKGKYFLRSYLTLALLHKLFPNQRNAETSQLITKLMGGTSMKFSNRSEAFVQFLGLLRIKKSLKGECAVL